MKTMMLVGQATGDEPAGGAAIGEALGATAAAGIATALIAVLIAGHRSGRIDWLARAGRAASRLTGLPAWAALPSTLLSGSLLIAVLGMYWDISLHIDNGRDAGPLANPAHYLILFGLYGVLLSGVLSAALAGERPTPTSVRVGNGWWAPAGGVVIVACGAFALSGFPLDDIWHRLFGQDVTLWGPTHLMLIGGASLATLGAMALMSEAVGALGRDPEAEHHRVLVLLRRGLLRAASSSRCRPSRASSTSASRSSGSGAAPGADHARRRRGARDRAGLPRPRRRAAGRARLPADPRLRRDHGRRRVGPDHAPLPALHRRGAARRGRLRPPRRTLAGRRPAPPRAC